MSQSVEASAKKGEMLVITNKTLPLSTDRITLFLCRGELVKAKEEMKSIKNQIADLENLLRDFESLSK